VIVHKTGKGGFGLSRRDIFIWIFIILFSNYLFGIIKEALTGSLEKLATDFSSVGIFQYMAWYSVFHLLFRINPSYVARKRDYLVTMAFCIPIFLPTVRMIWVAATGFAIYWWVFNSGDLKLRAAGIVLAALSVQEFWGHVLFHLFAYPLLCAETAVVGTMMEAARAGTVWQNNVITGPSGYGIVVYDECSSFHNLSLAMLCWVTISKMRDQHWRSRDFAIGSVVGISMIIWNVTRLCLMAWDIDLYHYWHDGIGAEIFAICASLSVLLISLYGVKPVDQPT
jgi:exosortase/archaeosortase family protein